MTKEKNRNHSIDIRDRKNPGADEIFALNFINISSPFRFRKYYRSGLRSHIFEVLLSEDLDKEINGIIEDGIRIYPRARPIKMFRIFRNYFKKIEDIFTEIKKYNLLLDVLGQDYIAISEEFIVDYTQTSKSSILLCGLQEYINGEILDPWKAFNIEHLKHLPFSCRQNIDSDKFSTTVRKNLNRFTYRIREMISSYNYIPDLAGVGNLIVTPDGGLKLVDINNIVPVRFEKTVPLDDRGYPACDVSIQVLFMLETNLLNKNMDPGDPLAEFFLAKERKERVNRLERNFYKRIESTI